MSAELSPYAFNPLLVDPTLQPTDNSGCVTATLSNLHRGFTGEFIYPARIDAETGRQPDEGLNLMDADIWLMDKGYRVQLIEKKNPLTAAFLDGSLSFEEVQARTVNADLLAFRALVDNYNYSQEDMERIALDYQTFSKPRIDAYEKQGLYVHENRIPTSEDIYHWTSIGAVVLAGEYIPPEDDVTQIGHYLMAFRPEQGTVGYKEKDVWIYDSERAPVKLPLNFEWPSLSTVDSSEYPHPASRLLDFDIGIAAVFPPALLDK